MRILNQLIFSILMVLSAHASIDPHVSFMGRIDESEFGISMAYSGCELEAKFTGSDRIGLNIKLISGEGAHFNVYLNGKILDRLEVDSSKESYIIASDLDPNSDYHLRLVRRTEAWQGVVLIESLIVSNSVEWLPIESKPTRKILCLGDSITCGASNELPNDVEVEGIDHHNAEQSYGWFLAKQLHAQVHLVSYGGKGLIRDWQGIESELTLPQFFERSNPDLSESLWDHQLYQPDLIVICVGQNDFNQGIVKEKRFVEAYVDFLNRIFEVHPEAQVLLCSSPMQPSDDPKRRVLEKYLENVVVAFPAKKGSQLRTLSLDHYPGSKHNAHPVVIEHQKIANEIYDVVVNWINWEK